MTCHECGRHNDPRRRYCGECGTDLHAPCQRCGFSNEVADKFCGGCGDRLAVTAQPMQPKPAPAPCLAFDEVEIIDGADLSALLGESAAATAAAAAKAAGNYLPEGKVTQDDLDSLFDDAATPC